jgi:hypothetical protein
MPDRTHETGEGRESRRDPRAASTVIVGVISIVLVLVTVFALEALYYRTVDREQQRKFDAEQPLEPAWLSDESTAQLEGYRWVDREAGTVAIPIERAMELVVEEQSGER